MDPLQRVEALGFQSLQVQLIRWSMFFHDTVMPHLEQTYQIDTEAGVPLTATFEELGLETHRDEIKQWVDQKFSISLRAKEFEKAKTLFDLYELITYALNYMYKPQAETEGLERPFARSIDDYVKTE